MSCIGEGDGHRLLVFAFVLRAPPLAAVTGGEDESPITQPFRVQADDPGMFGVDCRHGRENLKRRLMEWNPEFGPT
jgi:hypothetical protein